MRQFIFVRIAMLWIACCVIASFYFAFGGYLELTVVWGTMALCLSPSVWLYLGLLELRQLCQAQLDQIDSFRQRVHELESKPAAVQVVRSPDVPRKEAAIEPRIEIKKPSLAGSAQNGTAEVRRIPVIQAANGHGPNGNGMKPAMVENSNARLTESGDLRTAAQLRHDFAAHVRAGRFALALRTGDLILEQHPDTRAAREYQALRRHLLSRIEEQELEPANV